MKKILVLLLCFALVFSLAACGDKTSEEPTVDKPQQEETKPEKENNNISKDPVELPDWLGGKDDNKDDDKPDVEQPQPGEELPQNIDDIMFGKKIVNLTSITSKTLSELGYQPSSGISVWMTYSDFMSLAGVGYDGPNNTRLVVCTPEDAPTKIIGIVADREETQCVFYKGIKVGMSEADCMAIIGDMDKDETESFGTKKYAVHNKENSLVVSIEDGVVEEVIVCVSKEARLNLSAAGAVDIAIQDFLEYTYPQNEHDNWIGYGIATNCTLDIDDIVIDGQKFAFNELTLRHILAMGFVPQSATFDIVTVGDISGVIASETFKSADGKELSCVFDADGKIEYLKINRIDDEDPNAKQTTLTLYKELTFGAESKTLEKVFKDCAGSTIVSGSYYLVKSEDVTLWINCEDGLIDSITIINNKLVW